MNVQELKSVRVNIDGLFKAIGELPKSREVALAYTKCQESKMWLGKALSRLDNPNPYPESKDPTSGNKIAPTADTNNNFLVPTYYYIHKDKIFYTVDKEAMFASEDTNINIKVECIKMGNIETIKWIRGYVDSIAEVIRNDFTISTDDVNSYRFEAQQSYAYIVECGMWLGMELGRIRDNEEKITTN